MTSIEFIKQKLNELVNIFPTIKCAYEFDAFDNTHTVEIMPSEVYNDSQSFYSASEEIEKEFVATFPYEGLYFIDDKSIAPVKNILFEVKGRDYNTELNYSIALPQSVCIPVFKNIPEFMLKHSTIAKEFIQQAFAISSMCNTVSDMHREQLEYLNTKDLAEVLVNNEAGETSFAMAA